MKRILATIFIFSLLAVPFVSSGAVKNDASKELEIQVLKLKIQILQFQIQLLQKQFEEILQKQNNIENIVEKKIEENKDLKIPQSTQNQKGFFQKSEIVEPELKKEVITVECYNCHYSQGPFPRGASVKISQFLLTNSSTEDVNLSAVSFWIDSDFSKNIQSLMVFIKFPADQFGVSQEYSFVKKEFKDHCKKMSWGGDLICSPLKENILNFSWESPAIIPAGKSVILSLSADFTQTNSIPFQVYQHPLALKDCRALTTETQKEIFCSPNQVYGQEIRM